PRAPPAGPPRRGGPPPPADVPHVGEALLQQEVLREPERWIAGKGGCDPYARGLGWRQGRQALHPRGRLAPRGPPPPPRSLPPPGQAPRRRQAPRGCRGRRAAARAA